MLMKEQRLDSGRILGDDGWDRETLRVEAAGLVAGEADTSATPCRRSYRPFIVTLEEVENGERRLSGQIKLGSGSGAAPNMGGGGSVT